MIKEPNTHIYSSHFLQEHPGLIYIYVVRHGLDMAYSTNRQQARNWGAFFGIDPRVAQQSPIEAQLMLWIKANERINAIRQVYGERVFLLRFEELVQRPGELIATLLAACGLHFEEGRIGELAALVRKPESVGRYLREDWKALPEEAIERVKSMGFDIKLPRSE